MKTSDFPSYTHFKMITENNTKGPFRAFMISNAHNNKTLVTLTVESFAAGVCPCPIKISIEKDGGSIILPLHVTTVLTISTSSGTLGTDVFVYGLA